MRGKYDSRIRFGVWLIAAGLVSTVGAPPLRSQDVLAGIDLWTTPGGGTSYQDFSATPIPAGFFDPGSDPFNGTIVFVGNPLPNLGGPMIFPADTVVRRRADAVLPGPGSQDTVPIEIVALNLVSVQPITVTYTGGMNPELWDVRACLSAVNSQPQGMMTIHQNHPNGGTFDSQLPVLPRLVFVRQSDMAMRTADPVPPILLAGTNARWVYNPNPALQVVRVMPGAITDGNCDGAPDPPLPPTTNFAAGVWSRGDECPFTPTAPQVKRLTQEQAMLAAHGVIIAQPPPPDTDGDGIGNDADNCPTMSNPLQQDSDNDSVGDLCDNCVSVFNPCQEDGDGDGRGDACEIVVTGPAPQGASRVRRHSSQ